MCGSSHLNPILFFFYLTLESAKWMRLYKLVELNLNRFQIFCAVGMLTKEKKLFEVTVVCSEDIEEYSAVTALCLL
jgi:hypothetical protein